MLGKKKQNPEQAEKTKKPKEVATPEARVRRLSKITGAMVLIALIGASFGIYSQVSMTSLQATYKDNTIATVVSTRDVAAGEVIESTDIEVCGIPAGYHVADAISSPEDIIGTQALTTISKGTQISPALLAGEQNLTSLSTVIASDKQAVTVATSAEAGLAGLLKQGNTVKVVTSGNTLAGETILQTLTDSARVVALDGSLTGATTSYTTVTLEVTAAEADLIREAQFSGTVSLILLPALAEQGVNNG